jgi:glycosyltransferase involved in cell wall biosynthesis
MTNKFPRVVSVIIPALNAANTIGEQLRALSSQTYPRSWEITVADNGSQDGTLELVRDWAEKLPSLKIVDASGTPGAGHTRNAGAAASSGDLLLFCDADDIADPGWISAAVEAAKEADLVGGRMEVNTLNDHHVLSWRKPLQTDKLPISLGFLPYSLSSNIAVRAAVFRELGGWSEDFPTAAAEDVEFSWRAQLASYRLSFASDAVMHYRYRPDLSGLVQQFYRRGSAQARLYRLFRDQGVTRPNAKQVLAAWAYLLLGARNVVRGNGRRGAWLAQLAMRAGRVQGSMRARVLFL